ncbi:TPA: hypothetical protein ACGXMH_003594 [Bacillus mobilis]
MNRKMRHSFEYLFVQEKSYPLNEVNPESGTPIKTPKLLVP